MLFVDFQFGFGKLRGFSFGDNCLALLFIQFVTFVLSLFRLLCCLLLNLFTRDLLGIFLGISENHNILPFVVLLTA